MAHTGWPCAGGERSGKHLDLWTHCEEGGGEIYQCCERLRYSGTFRGLALVPKWKGGIHVTHLLTYLLPLPCKSGRNVGPLCTYSIFHSRVALNSTLWV